MLEKIDWPVLSALAFFCVASGIVGYHAGASSAGEMYDEAYRKGYEAALETCRYLRDRTVEILRGRE